MDKSTLQSIRERSSHRKYLPQQLTEQQLETIVQAALQAPSAVNAQPWHFSVVQDQELLKRVHQAAAQTAREMDASKRPSR